MRESNIAANLLIVTPDGQVRDTSMHPNSRIPDYIQILPDFKTSFRNGVSHSGIVQNVLPALLTIPHRRKDAFKFYYEDVKFIGHIEFVTRKRYAKLSVYLARDYNSRLMENLDFRWFHIGAQGENRDGIRDGHKIKKNSLSKDRGSFSGELPQYHRLRLAMKSPPDDKKRMSLKLVIVDNVGFQKTEIPIKIVEAMLVGIAILFILLQLIVVSLFLHLVYCLSIRIFRTMKYRIGRSKASPSPTFASTPMQGNHSQGEKDLPRLPTPQSGSSPMPRFPGNHETAGNIDPQGLVHKLIGLWKSNDNEHTIRFYENRSFSRQSLGANGETEHGIFQILDNAAIEIWIETGEHEIRQVAVYEIFFDQESLILESSEDRSRVHYLRIRSAANL